MTIESDEYERIARVILNSLREHLGYEQVTGSSRPRGRLSGRRWQIDITAYRTADKKILFECRRKGRPLDANQVGAYHFKAILDIGADGAIMVSSSGFQQGAIDVAKALKIGTATLNADATEHDFVLALNNQIFKGISFTDILTIEESTLLNPNLSLTDPTLNLSDEVSFQSQHHLDKTADA